MRRPGERCAASWSGAPLKTCTLLFAAALAVLAAARPAEAKTNPSPLASETGTAIHGEVSESRGAARLYLFRIPDDAVQVDVSVQSVDGEVSLRAVCGVAPPPNDDWSWG